MLYIEYTIQLISYLYYDECIMLCMHATYVRNVRARAVVLTAERRFFKGLPWSVTRGGKFDMRYWIADYFSYFFNCKLVFRKVKGDGPYRKFLKY